MLFTYIKWSKDSSVKHYQDNNERLKEGACERYQSLSQEEKNNNMGKNDIKISLKMKNRGWSMKLSIENNITEWKKSGSLLLVLSTA